MLQLRLKKAGLHGYTGVRLDEIRESGERIMLVGSGLKHSGERASEAGHFFQVVTLRNDRIVDMQDCRSRTEALRALGGE